MYISLVSPGIERVLGRRRFPVPARTGSIVVGQPGDRAEGALLSAGSSFEEARFLGCHGEPWAVSISRRAPVETGFFFDVMLIGTAYPFLLFLLLLLLSFFHFLSWGWIYSLLLCGGILIYACIGVPSIYSLMVSYDYI